MQDTPKPIATWRIVAAAVLDFLTAFMVLGYLVGLATGGTTDTGFKLDGWPALLLFGLVIVYFVVGNRTGGTLWKRILGVPPRRKVVPLP